MSAGESELQDRRATIATRHRHFADVEARDLDRGLPICFRERLVLFDALKGSRMPPRIPLPTDDELSPEHRDLLGKVPALNVFRMVAGTRRGLRPFLQLGGAVLSSSLDTRRREIVVLRVAHATRAGYERAQHERLARDAGVSDEEISAIATEEPVSSLDEEGNLLCRVADEVTRNVRLSDDALEQIIDRYGAREAAEVILLMSYYNMVSRFLESTRVELEDEPSVY